MGLLPFTTSMLQFSILLWIVTHLWMKSNFLYYGYKNLGKLTTATGASEIKFDSHLNWPDYYIQRLLSVILDLTRWCNHRVCWVFLSSRRRRVYVVVQERWQQLNFFLCGATAADNSLQKCEVQFLETETISDNVLLFNNTRDLGSNVRNAQYLCAESYYPLRVVLSSVLHNTLWIFRSS